MACRYCAIQPRHHPMLACSEVKRSSHTLHQTRWSVVSSPCRLAAMIKAFRPREGVSC